MKPQPDKSYRWIGMRSDLHYLHGCYIVGVKLLERENACQMLILDVVTNEGWYEPESLTIDAPQKHRPRPGTREISVHIQSDWLIKQWDQVFSSRDRDDASVLIGNRISRVRFLRSLRVEISGQDFSLLVLPRFSLSAVNYIPEEVECPWREMVRFIFHQDPSYHTYLELLKACASGRSQ